MVQNKLNIHPMMVNIPYNILSWLQLTFETLEYAIWYTSFHWVHNIGHIKFWGVQSTTTNTLWDMRDICMIQYFGTSFVHLQLDSVLNIKEQDCRSACLYSMRSYRATEQPHSAKTQSLLLSTFKCFYTNPYLTTVIKQKYTQGKRTMETICKFIT